MGAVIIALCFPIPAAAQTYTIPYVEGGVRPVVTVSIDGAPARMLVDTGSRFVALSGARAKAQDAPRYPVAAATGLVMARLVTFSRVEAGGAVSEMVEGALLDAAPNGVDGLLGQSFLADFIVTLDPARRVMELRAPDEERDHAGLHPRRWWTARFNRFGAARELFEAMAAASPPGLSAARTPGGLTPRDVARLRDHYTALTRELARIADNARVPPAWREIRSQPQPLVVQ
ncbi:MAG: clan AA aspartic protease [Nitrospinae bacterium]|nr:clan AA aspartic protease [Nitrospinota bacterium]